MMTVHTTIDIHVTDPSALDEQLESAHQSLQALAQHTRTNGILVTRHAPGRYTAQLSDQVPYGTTQQQIL
ncbi:hypothetical protein [Paenarthrobacter aromaticivorans]|uniref:Uncharacterized protein n=1 Tax=Paenarthrobacter aromaticivorans TaxID=2849150 RepID=A0ABS6I7N9_9MICC|nr:hypothetical protein [Paenarthrobacter sp. MMS21-TAE1-1]MBU8867738.1 hypothetical protein [Paenarthrobacter sp. MMS21-TAE1-1]